jgi:cytochrome bd ubiquinol oxidase subunit II
MFETLTHFQLQLMWWFIMSVVGALLVFLLFVQGGQTLVKQLGKSHKEENMVINSIGRKWEFTFTTLVMFAAGMFAAFPLWYATSLGGAYFFWKLLLVCFVLQAVSFEFRRKKGNFLGQKSYDWFLTINGYLGTVLLGVVVATFFTGSDFTRTDYNLSTWGTQWFGLELFFSFTNISLGLALLFLARTLGAMYIINNIHSPVIWERARKQVVINSGIFLVFFLFFMSRILLMQGYAYDPATGEVFLEPYKYLNNYLQMPVTLVLLLGGVLMVLYGIGITWFKHSHAGIWFSGPGTFFVALSLFFIVGFNNTAFYPAFDLQSSLTIVNASASQYTLTVMSYIALSVPIIFTYVYFTWRAIDRSKITEEDMDDSKGHHIY